MIIFCEFNSYFIHIKILLFYVGRILRESASNNKINTSSGYSREKIWLKYVSHDFEAVIELIQRKCIKN